MADLEDKKAREKADKAAAEAKKKAEEEAERERRRTDTNYNPLLHNGMTNKDIFRTLMFHFKTDNFLPVEGVAEFVKNLL